MPEPMIDVDAQLPGPEKMTAIECRARFFVYLRSAMKDENLFNRIRQFLNYCPTDFFRAPASSSGQYHPPYTLGDGGLVRHTVVAMEIGLDLAKAYGLSEFETDAVVAALALHDTYKGGTDQVWVKTYGEHARLAAEALIRYSGNNLRERKFIALVSEAIETHMSMWGEDYARMPIHRMSPVAQVVSVADYIASRKYLTPADKVSDILEEFFGWEAPNAGGDSVS
jgi:HD superfamily phosphohydrolase YqeK